VGINSNLAYEFTSIFYMRVKTLVAFI